MFALPPGIVIFVTRLAPLALVGLPLVEAVNVGLKPSALQPSAWNGVFTVATAPNVEVSVELVPSGCTSQLVGLSAKPCLLMLMFSERSRSGIPATIVGRVDSAVTRAVF